MMDACSTSRSARPTAAPPSTGRTSGCARLPRCRWRRRCTRYCPDGLRRGSTVSVTGSVSLLLALLGAASADGAWCALVGFPRISAEAAGEYGIDLRRLALVPTPDAVPAAGRPRSAPCSTPSTSWPPARPGGRGLPPGDVRRLAARARSKDAVLVPYLTGGEAQVRTGGGWPGPMSG